MNKFLDRLVKDKEQELLELKKLQAQVEEIEKLNRVNVHVRVDGHRLEMYYKDTRVTNDIITGQFEEMAAKYIINFFAEAHNGVNLYISNYGELGTIGNVIGNLVAKDKKFKVFKLREVMAR